MNLSRKVKENKMKKIFFGIAALILIIGGAGFAWYKVTYGGGTYYVQITKDGKEKSGRTDSGDKYTEYIYDINSYQKDGKEKKVNFMADHNLRKEAYLKLTVNSVKGVTSWEEVKKQRFSKKPLRN